MKRTWGVSFEFKFFLTWWSISHPLQCLHTVGMQQKVVYYNFQIMLYVKRCVFFRDKLLHYQKLFTRTSNKACLFSLYIILTQLCLETRVYQLSVFPKEKWCRCLSNFALAFLARLLCERSFWPSIKHEKVLLAQPTFIISCCNNGNSYFNNH